MLTWPDNLKFAHHTVPFSSQYQDNSGFHLGRVHRTVVFYLYLLQRDHEPIVDFKSGSSGLWRRVVLWYDTNVSKVHFTLKTEAAWASETLECRNTKRRHNTEDLNLNLHRRENLKFPVLESVIPIFVCSSVASRVDFWGLWTAAWATADWFCSVLFCVILAVLPVLGLSWVHSSSSRDSETSVVWLRETETIQANVVRHC
jgi:hypothetical protein